MIQDKPAKLRRVFLHLPKMSGEELAERIAQQMEVALQAGARWDEIKVVPCSPRQFMLFWPAPPGEQEESDEEEMAEKIEESKRPIRQSRLPEDDSRLLEVPAAMRAQEALRQLSARVADLHQVTHIPGLLDQLESVAILAVWAHHVDPLETVKLLAQAIHAVRDKGVFRPPTHEELQPVMNTLASLASSVPATVRSTAFPYVFAFVTEPDHFDPWATAALLELARFYRSWHVQERMRLREMAAVACRTEPRVRDDSAIRALLDSSEVMA